MPSPAEVQTGQPTPSTGQGERLLHSPKINGESCEPAPSSHHSTQEAASQGRDIPPSLPQRSGHLIPTPHEGQTGGLETLAPQSESPSLQVRRLTVIECQRLQGFPDHWTLPSLMGDSTPPSGTP